MDDMYQPAALFIGLRYMRGRAADRFGRFVSWLNYRYYAWRNGAGDGPVGDERL